MSLPNIVPYHPWASWCTSQPHCCLAVKALEGQRLRDLPLTKKVGCEELCPTVLYPYARCQVCQHWQTRLRTIQLQFSGTCYQNNLYKVSQIIIFKNNQINADVKFPLAIQNIYASMQWPFFNYLDASLVTYIHIWLENISNQLCFYRMFSGNCK